MGVRFREPTKTDELFFDLVFVVAALLMGILAATVYAERTLIGAWQ